MTSQNQSGQEPIQGFDDRWDEGAIFYDCLASERLTCSSIEEAIEIYLETVFEADMGILELIQKYSPILVTAHKRMQISENWYQNIGNSALELIAENFSENYGDPDGGYDGFDREAFLDSRPLMIEAVKRFVSHGDIWACVTIGERSFSALEVENLMREHREDWFEGVEPTDPSIVPSI
jgi:hypothetical protein